MYSRQKKLFIFVTAMVALVLILFSVAVFKTFQATNLLKNAQFYKASESAKAAQTVVSLFEKATFNSVQTISAWKSGLQIIQDTNQLHQAVTTQSARIAGSDANFSIAELNKPVQNLRISVTEFGNATKNAWLLQKILNSNQKKLLTDTSALLTQSATAIDLLSQENQRWIVLFQNNQEIRATGGFMGSYAIISLQDGVVSEIIIEDIYDADGQFTGFLSAPPGLEKYLSGGRGVRLPNANWSVDFPTASQEILQLFALSGRADVDGIIAISLPLIEDLVNIVGPLQTPDFTDPVTGETLSEILRSDREDFFPGSTSKKVQITAIATQLRIKIAGVNSTQISEIAGSIQSHILEKNITAFALNPVLQEIIISNKLDGSVTSPSYTSLLASIESNVGINKANKAVTRNINLEKTASTYVLAINWTHDGSYKSTEVPSTAYVNYHRIFTDPDWQVESILIQGKSVLPEHQRIITTKNGDSYLETGFLVVVPEFENVTAAITLSSSAQKPLYFIKQAGIEPFELLFSQNISGKQEISTFLISQNTILPNSTP